MSQILRIGAVALAFIVAPLTAAFADRAPTAAENAEIGNILFAEGFTSWGKIELDDDGEWEVENAIDQDGRVRDITLDTAFMIIDSEENDDDVVGVRPLN
jgi:hypothetical protein